MSIIIMSMVGFLAIYKLHSFPYKRTPCKFVVWDFSTSVKWFKKELKDFLGLGSLI